MFAVSMAIFAAVIAVVALGVASLTMSALARGVRRMDLSIHALSRDLAKSSSVTIKAELDDLRGALDVLRASHRKEFGSLWARVGGKPNGEDRVPVHTVAANDASFEALLDLQSRPPVQPT